MFFQWILISSALENVSASSRKGWMQRKPTCGWPLSIRKGSPCRCISTSSILEGPCAKQEIPSVGIVSFQRNAFMLDEQKRPPFSIKDLFKKLLHVEDTPERTALAYSIGIFLGFSPFLGLHTLIALAIAFLFKLNRVAILLGAWSNTPWWIVPYYTIATWVGMLMMGFQIDQTTIKGILQSGINQGFFASDFWFRLTSQWGLLLSFMIGSLVFSLSLSLIAYPLSMRWIKFYHFKISRSKP